jgi:hypothetical protein
VTEDPEEVLPEQRIIVMPGARMLRTVTTRLTPPTSEAMPVIWMPMA